MTEQNKPEFILWDQQRRSGYRMRADSMIDDGDTLRLIDGGISVAISSPRGTAVNTGAMVASFRDVVAKAIPAPPPMRCYSAPPSRGAWLLVGVFALGLVVGIGVTAQCLGAW
ncbi:hypothetical protein [Pseudomonas sp. TE50-2]|uniref:hypothetical protein n=1 Tax=Pseudomonas sp. TE50-2 TaxID=3142707 RepID=UPI003467DBA5